MRGWSYIRVAHTYESRTPCEPARALQLASPLKKNRCTVAEGCWSGLVEATSGMLYPARGAASIGCYLSLSPGDPSVGVVVTSIGEFLFYHRTPAKLC